MRRTLTAIAVPLVAVLALTACSDDSDDSAATSTETTTAPAAAETGSTIADVAGATPQLSTLTAAVTAADLGTTLSSPGPFTVFAPTDEAFDALPAGVVDKLLLECNKDALVKVLTYHVVEGKVMAADVTAGDVPTVEGGTVTLATDGGVTVNDATVVTPDVMADNGVVHVIDGVLLPSDLDPAALKASC
jgi:uncharacterized surface protein with fasciclin (FAS1) repeats